MAELSIVIPSYNEIKTLPEVLQRIEKLDLDLEVIVVDDGSNDGTYDYLKSVGERFRFKLTPIRHNINKGKGAALRSGIERAGGRYVIIQDADLEYDPQNIILLYSKLKEGYDVVYGSRLLNRENQLYSVLYLYGNKFLTSLINILFSSRFTDSYTCYKGFKAEIAKSLNISSSGFEVEAEISCKVAWRRYSFCEVGVRYKPRTRKEGKKIKLKDAVKGVLKILKMRFVSLYREI